MVQHIKYLQTSRASIIQSGYRQPPVTELSLKLAAVISTHRETSV
jgi:hypothetical protein